MRIPIMLLAVLVAAPAAAQIQSRPSAPPLVNAANESWYQLREAVPFAGELYYPAGASVFFNGNTMVRTGSYDGVPIYADTTLEPYSVVLLPIGRGLMQPYERPRRGDLAGTTGSRAPSFPGQLTPAAASVPQAAVAPTVSSTAAGTIAATTAPAAADLGGLLSRAQAASVVEPARGAAAAPQPTAAGAVGTAGILPVPRPAGVPPLLTLLRPQGNDGVWIRYRGAKWVSAGDAVAFASGEFQHVGEYGTFPVFSRGVQPAVIYLPTSRAGLVAPYRLKP